MNTLYEKDSKGKLRVWEIWTHGATLSERSGLMGGKLVQHNRETKGKNIGKTNETSPMVQAQHEAQAKRKKKLDEGYFRTEVEAMTNVVLLPMLALAFEKALKHIDWLTAVFQPKLDGMRCLAIIDSNNDVKLISRKGKPITTLPHLVLALQDMKLPVPEGGQLVLDGELYAHGLTFQENMRLIKKHRPGLSDEVKYHVYDLVDDDGYANRYLKLMKYIPDNQESLVSLVPTYSLNGTTATTAMADLKAFQADCIGQGYEGSIIRWGTEGYQLDTRSKYLVKYKEFQDLACPITDVIPMDNAPKQGKVVCHMPGKPHMIFTATPKKSHAEREEMLLNKQNYIGTIGEIRFFEYTDAGLPRFPIYLDERIDK